MAYNVRPLSCDPTKLKGLAEKLVVSHWENNYGGAVRRLNAITEQLAALDFAKAPVFVINGLKREELIAMNSMILHELYFDGLGGDGVSGGSVDQMLRKDFGSVDRWRAEFIAMGKALGGGSGWVLLTYSQRDRRLVNPWAADHTGGGQVRRCVHGEHQLGECRAALPGARAVTWSKPHEVAAGEVRQPVPRSRRNRRRPCGRARRGS
jgi:Fe-Mn family superoxide dismutase